MAAVTIPALELQGSTVTLKAINAHGADDPDASALAEAADLPDGFSAVWLRTGCINLKRTRRSGGAIVTSVDIAEELCRFLAIPPESYQEFRLYEYIDVYPFAPFDRFPKVSLLFPGNAIETCSGRLINLQDAAAAMQRFAHTYDLAVSVSDDQTHVRVVRV